VTQNRSLVDVLDDALPQTQCTRCGYADCRAYAEGIAVDGAPINQCPPGGAEGIARLAGLTGRPVLRLNDSNGTEAPRALAVIDEAWCIGCTLCLQACPVDCIVGGAKQMHTVVVDLCTGCELCLPVCPVDCIALVPTTGSRTGWQAWTQDQAKTSRRRHAIHKARLERDERTPFEPPATDVEPPTTRDAADRSPTAMQASQRRQATIEAALARARAARAQP
jgi:Na+-translocating ferredoxin:NAD+ oxidoreductase subunit B